MNKTAPIDKQPSTIEGEIYNIIDTAIIEGVDPDNHGYAAKQAHSAITKLIREQRADAIKSFKKVNKILDREIDKCLISLTEKLKELEGKK